MSRTPLDPILAHLRGEPSRTWSIIITVYGDAIVPRGGAVWLGTLLTIFRSLEIGDGVVRTAMSRLASDGWLERSRVGRNSFYRLAEKGQETFRRASEHIYRRRAPDWSGAFEMIVLGEGVERDTARPALEAAGFGMTAPGVWIAVGGTSVPDIGPVIRLTTTGAPEMLRAVAARSWSLEATAEAYARFIAAFAPLADAISAGHGFSDLDALVARILLIHEYRRIVLRDPLLPADVLPVDWPGTQARAICARVYRALLPASEHWLDANAIDEGGAALAGNPIVFERFRD